MRPPPELQHPEHNGEKCVSANSKDPTKGQVRRPVDQKPGTATDLAHATVLPPGVWVDEGWGYQVGSSAEPASPSIEFEPIEYEMTSVARQPADGAVVTAPPVAPDVPKGVEPAESDASGPSEHWTLVANDPPE